MKLNPDVFNLTGNGRRARRDGITLIELMVVILVIGVLFAIMMPAIGRLRQRAHEVNTQSAAVALRDAILQYHFEYGVWPIVYQSAQNDYVFEGDNYKVLAFLDINHTANKKKILFLKQAAGGTPPRFDDFIQDNLGSLIDPWGTSFRITIKTTAANRPVEVRSAGQDMNFGTGYDIISR